MDISSHLEPLQSWLNKLEKRERHTVIAGSLVLLVTILYLAIWDPVFSTLEAEKMRYQSQRELLSWMQDSANEAGILQASGASTASRFKNQSVSALVERSATTSGVRSYIKNLPS